MISILCLSLALIGQAGVDSKPKQADAEDIKREYKDKASAAGRDASQHVLLALWCETRGLKAERVKHLVLAVHYDPSNETARGLIGQVFQKEWLNPDTAAERMRADQTLAKKLAEYHSLRDETTASVASDRARVRSLEEAGRFYEAASLRVHIDRKLAPKHIQLGDWCAENGLNKIATAHYTTAKTLDPSRDLAWKRLGYIKHDGRWMTHEQIEASKEDKLKQIQADHHWEQALRKWWNQLGDKRLRNEADRLLDQVTDPRAVPSILKVFSEQRPAVRLLAIRMLSHIEGPEAVRALSSEAIGNDDEGVRAAAIRALASRPIHTYAGPLIDMIRTPATYEYRPVMGPGSTGGLVVDTPRYRIERVYTAPPPFTIDPGFRGYVGYDINGMPIAAHYNELKYIADIPTQGMTRFDEPILQDIEARTARLIAIADVKAVFAQQLLMNDIRSIETANARVGLMNSRVIAVLQDAARAPKDLGGDETAWHTWYYDKLGYRYTPPRPILISQLADPMLSAPDFTYLPAIHLMSTSNCFAAGTLVHTTNGKKAIESLDVGDDVLSQNVSTGALDFKPILLVHHDPPSETIKLTLDDRETITTIGYHRFWRPGIGWTQANDLKVGDHTRVLDGVMTVTKVEPGPVVPVYNLDVADHHTFFVGENDVLVHDNSFPDSSRIVPFDAIERGASTRSPAAKTADSPAPKSNRGDDDYRQIYPER